MTTTSAPTTHPEWCDLNECTPDAWGAIHNGKRELLTPTGLGWERGDPIEVYPNWAEECVDGNAGEPCVYFYGAGEGPLTPAEARHLAAMLTRAAEQAEEAGR